MPSFISSYQLNKPSKCIAPFYGICETHRFIVGTCSHTGTNDIGILEYNELKYKLSLTHTYSHPGEIWKIISLPFDHKLFITFYRSSGEFKVSLWKLKGFEDLSTKDYLSQLSDVDEDSIIKEIDAKSEEYRHIKKKLNSLSDKDFEESNFYPNETEEEKEREEKLELEQVYDFTDNIVDLLFIKPQTLQEDIKLIGYSNSTIFIYKYILNNIYEDNEIQFSDRAIVAVACDPFRFDQISIAFDNHSIVIYNYIEKQELFKFTGVHQDLITGLEYNPNRINQFLSYGKDGIIVIYDTVLKKIVKVLKGHDFWISKVHYNPAYDNYILSSSVDGILKLWCITDTSSEVLVKEKNEIRPDLLLTPLLPPGEAIYDIKWSETSPWIYTSLTYGGVIKVHQIIEDEIYKILF